MSKNKLEGRIKLASYNDLFGLSDEELNEENAIREISLGELHPFEGHPFRVLDDDKMKETVESVRKYGVLVPGIARPRKAGGYEIISGHRRHHASEIVGNKTMPMIIKNCTDDEATIIMVDANIQREDILLSEKAKAYKMKYEALKHQGKAGGITVDIMAEATGESNKTIQRYVWLANLTDELLAMVDTKKLGIVQGVEISFLPKEKQTWVYDLLQNKECNISCVQAAEIREKEKQGELTKAVLKTILLGESMKPRKVVFNAKKLDSYFPSTVTNEDIESVIIKLLEEWKIRGGTI